MSSRRRWGLLAAVVVVGVLVDQVTKHLATAHLADRGIVPVIEGFFDLRYARNPGAFFSLGADLAPDVRRAVFVLASLAASLLIVRLYARATEDQRALRAGLALLLSGALGNLIDRIVSGAVVDFVHLYFRDLHWATFNVADVLITAGLGFLVLDLFRRREEPTPALAPSPPPTETDS